MNSEDSLFKKIENLNAKALAQGYKNFEKENAEIEKIAKERAKICVGCEKYVTEPIKFLRIEDKRIPELSNKMCDACGCVLPFLLRQNKKSCKLEKWKSINS